MGISTGSKRDGVSQVPGEAAPSVPPIALWDVVGSLVLGVALVVSYPVLDLLSQNLAFFTAHKTVPFDVLGLTLLLTIVLPLLVALPAVMLMRLAPRVGIVFYAIVLGLLAAAASLPFVERLIDTPWLVGVAALGLGGLVVAACLRFRTLQTLLRWGAAVPVIVLAFFVFASPASGLILTPDTVLQETSGVGNPVPVVVLVLDELPVQSLMNAEGNIDDSRFPGFASLLDDFTWYRNTATMHHSTSKVMPVVLSGSPYRPDTEPSASGYPDNLFSLLGARYDTWAREILTTMCVPEICRKQSQPSATDRWRLLLNDASVVVAHVVLPEAATTRLPALDGTWTGFIDVIEQESSDTSDFDDFLASLTTAGESSLHYFHYVAPHHPWDSLPGGLHYPADLGIPVGTAVWGNDQHVVDQAHQRHMLQVGWVDGEIDRFVRATQGSSWYRDALVLVMADHGIAFNAGGRVSRWNEGEHPRDRLRPALRESPRSDHGSVDERPASLHDILPTIVDILDIEPAWRMLGVSLLEDPDNDRVRVFEGFDTIELPPTFPQIDQALARKVALFGSGHGWSSVYNFGPHSDLIGRSVEGLALVTESAEIELVDEAYFDQVDPNTGSVPALVRASVHSEEITADTWLAVAVNGSIAATAPVHDWSPQVAQFSVIVPPTSFVTGKNEVDFYRIEDTLETMLHPLEDD